MDISTIREQYPQYNDLGDAELAAKLHQSSYSDMPFDEFAGKIGFTPPVASPTNWTEGAPSPVRAAVGALPESQQLQALQILAPKYGMSNIKPWGNNFTWTEPKTGETRLYNQKGFGLNDVAGAASDIAQLSAGIGSGVLAGPETLGLGSIPAAAAAMAATKQGAISAAKSYVNGVAGEQGVEPLPDDSLANRAAQFGIDTGINTAAGGLGHLAWQVASPLAGKAAAKTIEAYKSLGLPIPSMGAVAESPAWKAIENGFAFTPGGAATMDKAAAVGRQNIGDGLSQAAANITDNAPTSVEGMGQVVQSGLQSGKKIWQDAATKSENGILGSFGGDAATLDPATQWIESEAAKLSPTAAKTFRQRMYGQIADEVKDATPTTVAPKPTGVLDAAGNPVMSAGETIPPTLNINTVKAARTRLLPLAGDDQIASAAGQNAGEIKALRSKLADGITQSITDPEALSAYDKYMADYANEVQNREMLDRAFAGKRDIVQTGNSVLSPRISSPRLTGLLDAMPTEDANSVMGGIINHMGTAAPGDGIKTGIPYSPSRLSTNWNAYGQTSPAVQEMLAGAGGKPLADTLTVANAMNKGSKFYNTSGTAATENITDLLQNIAKFGGAPIAGGLLGYSKDGDLKGAMAGAGAGILGMTALPYIGAKIATSPTAINLAASPAWQAATQAILPNLGRAMGVIASPYADKKLLNR